MRISVRRVGRDLLAVVMKTSLSKGTFVFGVEKEMNIILLFDIYLEHRVSNILSL